jgi:hypothetical protein
MQISVYRQGKLTEMTNLWQGMAAALGGTEESVQLPWMTSLQKTLRSSVRKSLPVGHEPLVISAVGAGGKTSLIYALAEEAKAKGAKVAIVTTTHMYVPKKYGIIDGDLEAVSRQLEQGGIVVAGSLVEEGKIGFVGEELYSSICNLADVVLVEADGSKRMPLKVPQEGEPVLPANTDLIVCLAGLTSLGQKLGDVCFRLEIAKALLRAHQDKLALQAGENTYKAVPVDADLEVTPAVLACLVHYGYLQPFEGKLPVLTVLNQGDTSKLQINARYIMGLLGVKSGLVVKLADVIPKAKI